MATTNEMLIKQRTALGRELLSCESGAFPGSREWRRGLAASKALEAFDAAHPEILASIHADKAADPAVQRSLRMED